MLGARHSVALFLSITHPMSVTYGVARSRQRLYRPGLFDSRSTVPATGSMKAWVAT